MTIVSNQGLLVLITLWTISLAEKSTFTDVKFGVEKEIFKSENLVSDHNNDDDSIPSNSFTNSRIRRSIVSEDEPSKIPHKQVHLIDLLSKRRQKRSKKNTQPTSKDSTFLDYDGWLPINNNNPMSDSPTFQYQPPRLGKVHFGSNPPSEKPLYPIIPKNPPVLIEPVPRKVELKSVNHTNRNDFIWPPEPIRNHGIDQYDYVYEYPVLDLDTAFSENNPSYKPFRYTLTSENPNDYYEYDYDEYEYSDPITRTDSDDEYLEESDSGTTFYKKVPPPGYLLKNSKKGYKKDVVQISELQNKENAYDDWKVAKPWILIETKTEKPSLKEDPSIASYIKPETHDGGDTVHYSGSGSILYKPVRDSEGNPNIKENQIHNHHLDHHMNSYKPSKSITANSLSELLRIFRYTHVTEEPKPTTQLPPFVQKGWRYTKPPSTATTRPYTRRIVHHNTFRYTTPSEDEDYPIEPTSPITPVITPPVIDNSFYEDRVAETNSLDGYLFSDSEASPEYARLGVKPNVVPISEKDKKQSKLTAEKTSIKPTTEGTTTEAESTSAAETSTETHSTTTAKINYKINIDSDASRRGQFIPYHPIDILNESNLNSPQRAKSLDSSTSSPIYVIYEGHSKVKMYGSKSGNKIPTNKKTNILIITTTEKTTEKPESTTIIPVTVVSSTDADYYAIEETTIMPSVDYNIDNNETDIIYTDYQDIDYENIQELLASMLSNGELSIDSQPERLTDAFKGLDAPWFRPNLKLPNTPTFRNDTQELLEYLLQPNLEELSKTLYPMSSNDSYAIDEPILDELSSDVDSLLTKTILTVEEPSPKTHKDIKMQLNKQNIETERISRSDDYPVPKPRLISKK